MTFLPIVERELRVAARKPSTFLVRVIAACVALVIGCGFLALATSRWFGFGATGLGKGLFATLTWLSFAAVFSAGLFFTSDCLSEEKREGTLGFLFLTDLRGYDVVLGKLLATSLRGFCALLSVFPILGVTLLLGGVTGAEFWKTMLALVNALFLSLTAGLFVSAISRDAQKALAATLLLLLLFAGVGPVIDSIIAGVRNAPFNAVASLLSPGYVFATAGTWSQPAFWPGLLVNQLFAWLFLALTCVLLPKTWQESAARPSSARSSGYAWKFGSERTRAKLRERLIDINPALWLACRERWQAVSFWGIIILFGVLAATLTRDKRVITFAWSFLAGLFTLLLYLGVASQAGRFFVDAQRSGFIELLLATPLSGWQIVQGQWRGLLRMFGLPLALFLAAHLLGSYWAQQSNWKRMATTMATATGARMAAAAAATNALSMTSTSIVTTTAAVMTTTTITPAGTTVTTISPGAFTAPPFYVTLAMSGAAIIGMAANVVALVWFGMWMGLTSKNATLATLKTIAFVQVIPWFVISFVSALSVPILFLPSIFGRATAVGTSQIMLWFPLITTGVSTMLYLLKDLGFSLWARKRLYCDFRERAVQSVSPIHLPPPLPLPPPPPPVLAAAESP